jgi:uncharacterized protein
LIVTMITLGGGIAARLINNAFTTTTDFAVDGAILAAAGGPAAYLGAELFRRLNSRNLTRIVTILLLAVGLLMMSGSLIGNFTFAVSGVLPRLTICLVIGAGVGIVVGLIGVGGNELMIPLLIVMFGIPIKEAGSVSLVVSLPVVLVGLWRFHVINAFKHRERDVDRTIIPLALGSVAGSVGGGFLAHSVPNALLKFLLGTILLFSAWQTYFEHNALQRIIDATVSTRSHHPLPRPQTRGQRCRRSGGRR